MKQRKEMKDINLGNVEEMEHWSKTSVTEPQPVGVHKKRKLETGSRFRVDGDLHVQSKVQRFNVYPVSRPAPKASMRRTLEEIRAPPAEVSRLSKTSSSLQYRPNSDNHKGKRCLDPVPSLEQLRNVDKNVIRRVNKQSENAAFSNARTPSRRLEEAAFAKAKTPRRRLEEEERWICARRKVKEVLEIFRDKCKILLNDGNKKGVRRVDLEAGRWFKENHSTPMKSVLGPIPGVEVGDQFHYRMELHLLGLHQHLEAGISVMDVGGRRVAASIVDSGVYDNVRENQESLIYCGHGGNGRTRSGNLGGLAEDQQPKRGNLALMNSIRKKNPIRVIRRSRLLKSLNYIYDGLYTAEKMWKERNSKGNVIFKFKLVKMQGQENLFSSKKTKE